MAPGLKPKKTYPTIKLKIRKANLWLTNETPFICINTSMKLLDIILLSLAAFFVIIGIYEIMTVGIGQAYTWIMVAVTLFLIYTYRKKGK